MAYCKTLLGLGVSFSLLSTVCAQVPSFAKNASVASLATATAALEPVSAVSATASASGDASSQVTNNFSSVYAQAQNWRYKVRGYYLGPFSASAEMQFAPINSKAYQANLAVSIAGQKAMAMTSKLRSI